VTVSKIQLPGGSNPEKLGYEAARAALAEVVELMESGELELENSIALWELGEVLARICDEFLANAQAKLAALEDEDDDD
jgi:exodeoxyribonuclease VII small subunit